MASKQGAGKIDWTDWTWNPIKGRCGFSCEYCYMHNINKRFSLDPMLRVDEKELRWCPRNPSKIFVCSQLDIMHEDIPDVWVDRVLNVIESHPQNTYQLLTKKPCMYSAHDMPKNTWVGATVDGLPFTNTNFMDMGVLETKAPVKFISFEPLIAFPEEVVGNSIGWSAIDWIIIGGDSRRGVESPPIDWAGRLIAMARDYGVAVWVKDNYPWPEFYGGPRLKEFSFDIEVIRKPREPELEICEGRK